MSHLFQDQTAVITGAGGVLCSEIAVKLAAEGAKTVLVGRTEEKLKKVEAQILAGRRSLYGPHRGCDGRSRHGSAGG